MLQDVYGFPIDVSRYQDFGFLRNYGLPFHVRVADGCVWFGMQSERYGRLLIRFAGAALTGGASPEAAVNRLRRAMPVYQALYPHPAVIKLQGHGPAAGGYAAIFRWPEGVNLRDAEAQRQLQRQPLLSRLQMIDTVFDFHLFAAGQGYVPVGLGDGSLAVDFGLGRVTVCDVDLYREKPALNDTGRLPGAAHFMPPEAYALGAPLDDLTAQYALGALAFLFFGAYASRERADWQAGEGLYRAAARACEEKRERRYPTLQAFVDAWREAAGRTI